ncbi:AarF/ABC1/UbiB kinase family protein [bacterium]|nr:AarF/ABC1/UbiB kinase family protein [bacterium]
MEPRPIRFLRNLGRMRQIVSVLLNYGFGDLVDRLHLRGYVRLGQRLLRRKGEPTPPLSRAQRVRLALEELGPTFVKFGQVLSTRPDLIPPDFIEELKHLRENVPPFSGDLAVQLITEAIGSGRAQIEDISTEPIAAGSLAQVHTARHSDGTKLAIKILRPGIRSEIETDLDLMHEFATLLQRYVPEFRVIDPVGLVRHFERVIRREQNLIREARTVEEFSRLFREDATLKVPRVYTELCSDSVLVMEFIDGIRVDDREELAAYRISPRAIAANGARIFLKQAFEFGVFHGDPHPGNIRILPDGSICLLDYGMIGMLDEQTRDLLIDLLMSIAKRDVARAVALVQKVGQPHDSLDVALLNADVRDFIESYYGIELGQLNLGSMLNDFVRILTTHGMSCPGDLMLLIRALVTLDGVGRSLDPDFNLAAILRPFVEAAVRRRYDPRRIASGIFDELRTLANVACQLPVSLERTLDKLSHNELRIQLEHRRLDQLINELDRSGNRIVIGLILSALIVASALLFRAGSGPAWISVSVFAISAFLGIWLIYGVFRSGRL